MTPQDSPAALPARAGDKAGEVIDNVARGEAGTASVISPVQAFSTAQIRRVLERRIGPGWESAPFGPMGVQTWHRGSQLTVIVSQAEVEGVEWVHASVARPDRDPTYADMAVLKEAVYGPERYAFQVFPAAERHVNIHPHALHLWGRADGTNVLPDFGWAGSI